MRDCWLIPGFLCSELFTDAARRNKLWIDQGQLIVGRAGKMRLAPDGMTPGPPDGVMCFLGGFAADWWTPVIAALEPQLSRQGHLLQFFSWDWRKDLNTAGVRLADSIRARPAAANPCAIVAHSAGGLVARCCWASLVSTGDQGRVRRIVTLCTPHQGTYAPVTLLSGAGSFVDDLVFYNRVLGNSLAFSPYPPPFISWSPHKFAQLAATWPAIYELLPVLDSPDSAEDPFRDILYHAPRWPTPPVPSQAWLDYQRDHFGPFLLTPQSVPPAWVLTTVAGDGQDTPDRLVTPQLLGSAAALGATSAGDGLVTVESATIAAAAVYTLQAAHSTLPIAAANSGQLAAWILDDRRPPDPPPPPVADPRPIAPIISDPPIAQLFGELAADSQCRGSKCVC